MPALPHNIEASGFHPGQYVGYGRGSVWRIKRVDHVRLWRATTQDGKFSAVEATNLKRISTLIEGNAR